MRKILVFFSLLSLLFIVACQSGKKGADNSANDPKGKNDSTIVIKKHHPNGGLWKVSSGKKVIRDGEVKYVMHGESRVYYKTPKDVLSTKAVYKNGKREGMFYKYYTDGKLYYEINYTEGKMDGIKKAYYKDGKPLAETPYMYGMIGTGTKEYTTKGVLLDDPELKVWYKKEFNSVMVYAKVLRRGEITKRVKFYEGDLVDGKYMYSTMQVLPMGSDGIANKRISGIPNYVSISAKVKSARNVYSLVNKKIAIK